MRITMRSKILLACGTLIQYFFALLEGAPPIYQDCVTDDRFLIKLFSKDIIYWICAKDESSTERSENPQIYYYETGETCPSDEFLPFIKSMKVSHTENEPNDEDRKMTLRMEKFATRLSSFVSNKEFYDLTFEQDLASLEQEFRALGEAFGSSSNATKSLENRRKFLLAMLEVMKLSLSNLQKYEETQYPGYSLLHSIVLLQIKAWTVHNSHGVFWGNSKLIKTLWSDAYSYAKEYRAMEEMPVDARRIFGISLTMTVRTLEMFGTPNIKGLNIIETN